MRVGVVGLGYVGLPLAVAFAEEGHEVVGLDADPRKIDALAEGRSYIEDVASERLAALDGKLTATSRYPDLSSCDAVIICVPTPLTNSREPDLSYMVDAATSLAAVLQKGQLIVLESTTYPGHHARAAAADPRGVGPRGRARLPPRLLPRANRSGPNRLHDPDHPEGRRRPERGRAPRRAVELYSQICDRVVEVSSPDAAELSKLLENIFRSVNIALVNEMAMLCERLGIDVWEVIDAAASKPFGFMRFDPGPGMGGHCLPVDPFYLSYKAREHDFYTEFIELAGKINQNQPHWCVRRIERALNDAGKATNGARVLLLGVSYKAGVGDIRESPALKIIRLLRDLGAEVSYHDPHVPELPDLELASAELDESVAAGRPGLHRHRPPDDRLPAGGRRLRAGDRLPRGHPRDRGDEPRPPLAAPRGTRVTAHFRPLRGPEVGGKLRAVENLSHTCMRRAKHRSPSCSWASPSSFWVAAGMTHRRSRRGSALRSQGCRKWQLPLVVRDRRAGPSRSRQGPDARVVRRDDPAAGAGHAAVGDLVARLEAYGLDQSPPAARSAAIRRT